MQHLHGHLSNHWLLLPALALVHLMHGKVERVFLCTNTLSCSDCNLVSDLGREVAPLTSMNDAGDRKWMRSSCRIFSRSITVLLPGKQQEKRPAQLRCHTPSTPTQLEQIGAKRSSAIVPNTPSSFSRRERMSGAIGEHARASAGEEESSCTYGVKIPEEPHTGT